MFKSTLSSACPQNRENHPRARTNPDAGTHRRSWCSSHCPGEEITASLTGSWLLRRLCIPELQPESQAHVYAWHRSKSTTSFSVSSESIFEGKMNTWGKYPIQSQGINEFLADNNGGKSPVKALDLHLASGSLQHRVHALTPDGKPMSLAEKA